MAVIRQIGGGSLTHVAITLGLTNLITVLASGETVMENFALVRDNGLTAPLLKHPMSARHHHQTH